jgi:hypothetical protein
MSSPYPLSASPSPAWAGDKSRSANANDTASANADDARLNSSTHINTSSSRNSPSLTARPRNPRLLSEQELKTQGLGSRNASLLPAAHPSRVPSRDGRDGGNGSRTVGLRGQEGRAGGASPVFGRGLWEAGWSGSWSALQGLANAVLGGEVEDKNIYNTPGSVGKGKGRDMPRRKEMGNGLAAGKGVPTAWGPTGLEAPLREPSLAKRDTAVRARKTASVLESHAGVNGGLEIGDGKGHKRHTSDDDPRMTTFADDAGDALVYVHHVKPSDTMSGVVLRYHCQPAVFRKANRLWPNDVLQVRKVVLLPVDACGVRGRPCEPPSDDRPSVDLLAPTPRDEEAPNLAAPNAISPWDSLTSNNTESPQPEEDQPPWTHVRWVLLDASPSAQPTEIARLPRKTLGYFPPRRKQAAPLSGLSTPRASIDTPSLTTVNESPRVTPSRRLSNLREEFPALAVTASIHDTNNPYFPPTSMTVPPPHPATRARRTSSTSSHTLAQHWMRGPGGVGTMAPNVRKPGPAQDGFNAWAAKHLPGLALGDLPSSAAGGGAGRLEFGFRGELPDLNEGSFGGLNIGLNTALGSLDDLGRVPVQDSGQGSGSGSGVTASASIEAAAAAVESWMRRLATKAPGTPKILGGSGMGTGREEEIGDLIELLDGPGSDDGRTFDGTSGGQGQPFSGIGANKGMPAPSTSRSDAVIGSVRGRYAGGISRAKAGKKD